MSFSVREISKRQSLGWILFLQNVPLSEYRQWFVDCTDSKLFRYTLNSLQMVPLSDISEFYKDFVILKLKKIKIASQMSNVLRIKLRCFFFDAVKMLKSLYNYSCTNRLTFAFRFYCLILAINVPSQVKCLNVQIYITTNISA